MSNKKIFFPRVHKASFVEEALKYGKNHTRSKTCKKFGISHSTFDNWRSAEKKGYVFENRKFKNKKRVYWKINNSKYSWEFKKIVIRDYYKFGFAKTKRKHEVPETTFLRWIKKDKNKNLKPKKNKYKINKEPNINYVRFNRKKLIL